MNRNSKIGLIKAKQNMENRTISLKDKNQNIDYKLYIMSPNLRQWLKDISQMKGDLRQQKYDFVDSRFCCLR